jgi:hypothetical protein
MKHKLWNIGLTERYTLYAGAAGMQVYSVNESERNSLPIQ